MSNLSPDPKDSKEIGVENEGFDSEKDEDMENSKKPAEEIVISILKNCKGEPPHGTQRKLSILPGLGGERKKSVSLPREFDIENDEESDDHDKGIYSLESGPKLYNYKNRGSIFAISRPTLEQLRNPDITTTNNVEDMKGIQPSIEIPNVGNKFGWIEGVLVRCLLNIWGVMLFLRLSWVVAQAGIGLAVAIILLSAVVTTLSALSMSAISTNGQIKGGGIYYMISRTLGPEFGGAVGAIFAFANTAAVAMHTVGFSESLNDLFKVVQVKIIDNAENDIRITGTCALIILQLIILIGTQWESKAQIVLLIILLFAIGDFLIGTFLGPQDFDEISRGFVGFNGTILAENFFPQFRDEHSFFTIFAIFFPAATGITAGANISGDLKDPSYAIPKGTLMAILITTMSYIIFAVFAGSTCLRDASGPVLDIYGFIDENKTEQLVNNWQFICKMSNQNCTWGMQNSFQIMELMSIFGPIIYAGCFAATLSSALACLLSAPKILQALSKDKLYPYIAIFGKGFRKTNDPYFAYCLTFFIALGFILIADLNAIAPLISNFYLAAYAMINFCVLHATIIKPLGFRPTFKYFNRYTSFLGFILCVSIMFLMSWVTALITLALLALLFFTLVYVKPDVNWGTSSEAQTFNSALKSIQSLNFVQDHIKNYRPQILVLSGRPSSRPTLIDFAHLLTKNISMMICGHIIQERQQYKVRNYLIDKGYAFLNSKKIRGFYTIVDDVDFEEGARCLMQASGIGKMRPNIVLVGFKSDWNSCDSEDSKAYFRVILDALDTHMGVAILKLREGLDYSNIIQDDPEEIVDNLKTIEFLNTFMEVDKITSEPTLDGVSNFHFDFQSDKKKKSKKEISSSFRGPGGIELPKNIICNLTQFQRKQIKSTIDIWWLYDDGGLTILLPYILKSRSIYKGCKLRVFTLAEKGKELAVQAGLATLLGKFRIDYSDLIVINDVSKKASDKSWKFFNELVHEYQNIAEYDSRIEDSELKMMKNKTNRHLRLRELLQEHSSFANLVVMTLPIPRRDGISSGLYLSWLDCLTKDLPGVFLLVRGNQESCLTFYS